MKHKHVVRTGHVNEIPGIYECARCKAQITLARGKQAPPCREHGAVSWRLVKAAR